MEHTLADEVDGWAIDVVRAFQIIDGVCAVLDRPHPALVPANIRIDERDEVRLVEEAPPAAPYIAPEAALTEASNVYSLGVILRELLGARADIARAQLESALRLEPAERPSLAAWRLLFTASGWQHLTAGAWHPPFVPAPTERALLDGMRDDGGRDVYADWLEQHGALDRASFLRTGAPAPAEDARWRAHVATARIENCFTPACARRWDALPPTAIANLRDCGTCRRQVYYCTAVATVENEARRGGPVAIDVALPDPDIDRTALVRIHTPIYDGPPANPPLPGYVAPSGNVLTRLFGLFRRR